MGSKKKTEEAPASPSTGSEVGAHEPVDGVKTRVAEDGDEVVIRMSKAEWDEIQAEEKAQADDPATAPAKSED